MADAIKLKTQMFFDRIGTALDRATKNVLSRFGAYVRRTARTSIKPARRVALGSLSSEQRKSFRIRTAIAKRKGQTLPRLPYAVSAPGQPPRSRTGLLRKFIFFSFDPIKNSVVVGPVLLATPTGAPEHLEHGGTAKIAVGQDMKTRRVKIEARPYMGPAFQKNLPAVPSMWRDAVKP